MTEPRGASEWGSDWEGEVETETHLKPSPAGLVGSVLIGTGKEKCDSHVSGAYLPISRSWAWPGCVVHMQKRFGGGLSCSPSPPCARSRPYCEHLHGDRQVQRQSLERRQRLAEYHTDASRSPRAPACLRGIPRNVNILLHLPRGRENTRANSQFGLYAPDVPPKPSPRREATNRIVTIGEHKSLSALNRRLTYAA